MHFQSTYRSIKRSIVALTLPADRIKTATRATEAGDEDAEEKCGANHNNGDNDPELYLAMESGGAQLPVAIFDDRSAIVVGDTNSSLGDQPAVVQRVFQIVAQISRNAA